MHRALAAGYDGTISGAVDLEQSGGDSNMDLAAYFSFNTMVGAHAASTLVFVSVFV